MRISPSLLAGTRGARGLALVAAVSAASCAHVPPQPIAPAETARRLEQRSLSDAEVSTALAAAGLQGPQAQAWTLDALTVAAWSLRPDMAAAADDIAASLAAERVAGQAPNPNVSLGPSYVFADESGNPSPWTLAAALDFTIETGGKREIRKSQAQAETDVRRWTAAETMWRVRADARRALVTLTLARRTLQAVENEVALRQAFAEWVETQIRFGMGTSLERLTAATTLAQAEAQLRIVRGDVAAGEAVLAAAVGISTERLRMVNLAALNAETLPPPDIADIGMLRDSAAVSRLSVRHALADYAVTEQALRQAVARQYPDVTLGPGYTFDKGDHIIALSVGFPVPLFHDESAAIAQAVATRTRTAGLFEAAQALALGEVDVAQARYLAALAALRDADLAVAASQRATAATQRRLQLGAADRGEIVTVQLTQAVAERTRVDALRAVWDALGALEDSVQRPLWPASALGAVPPTPEDRAR
jgi:cobalt-zinc-cadmium efflux system outer membrane protein